MLRFLAIVFALLAAARGNTFCSPREWAAAESRAGLLADRMTSGLDRLRPNVGNGNVATEVFSDAVYLAGVYSGRQSRVPGNTTTSTRARIPAFLAVEVRGG